jgi:predicted nucleic acid-binding protein
LELDPGEAEAIALAIELKADLLLLDERKGRNIAARLGVRSIGILGILIDAKQNGYVPAVKPIMDRLIQDAGFWIRREVYERVLSSANE